MSKKPLVTDHQKKKLTRYLGAGEEIIHVSGVSNRYFWIKFTQYLPFSFLLIGLPKLFSLIHKKKSLIYILTNRRFFIIDGIFTRKLTSAPLDQITHTTIEQNFWERFIFNSGQIIIITAGYDQQKIIIDHLGSPVDFKILLEDLTNQLKEKTFNNNLVKEEILKEINFEN